MVTEIAIEKKIKYFLHLDIRYFKKMNWNELEY